VMPRYERGWSEHWLRRLGTGWRWRGWLSSDQRSQVIVMMKIEGSGAVSDAGVGIDDSEWRPGS
jgi:hypothetical protein